MTTPISASLRWIAVGALATASLFALGTFLFRGALHPARGYTGTPFEPPATAPDFVLASGNGGSTHLIDRRYPLTFLFFGYTSCPDECPLALASLGQAYRKLSAAQRAGTRIVFVTVDPVHDTPPVVQRFVSRFEPHIVGLTGSPQLLATVWKAYGVRVEGTSHEIGHGDAIYAIDATGRMVLEYPPDARAADLAADAARLSSPKT